MIHPRLSKSSYLYGKQCHLRLWHHYHAQDLATPSSEAQRLTFDTGHEVGELALQRYPGGQSIGHDHHHTQEALADTQQMLATSAAPAFFEPAFEHQGVFFRADVLERLPGGGWRLVEVKSAIDVKRHVRDVALQLWVLRGAGVDVRGAGVLALNRRYVYDGARLDVDALFKLHPVFDKAMALQDTIGAEVRAMRTMLARSEAPRIDPGAHCFTPYPCPYYAHCTRNVVRKGHGVEELPGIRKQKLGQLQAAGIDEIKDIPESFPLNRQQRAVRRAVREGRVQVHGNLREALSAIKPPVRHLDFETFALAVPRFAGTRPYQTMPFLFSVHAEGEGEPPAHADYLHESDDDPTPMLVERLLDAVGTEGTVCVYSDYEQRVLRELATAVPHQAAELEALEKRLFNMLPVVRNCCYHPEFRGSFSLKRVLPALAPHLGYDDLAIADGNEAAALYRRALDNDDSAARQRTFADLRAYCERDTLATVALRKALAALAESAA